MISSLLVQNTINTEQQDKAPETVTTQSNNGNVTLTTTGDKQVKNYVIPIWLVVTLILAFFLFLIWILK
jgi:DNA-binding protein YbaB